MMVALKSRMEALVAGHTYTATLTGSQTNVGSSANVASAAVILDASNNDVTGNYDISYVDGTPDGGQARAIEITADSGTKVYDGTALTQCGQRLLQTEVPGGRSHVHGDANGKPDDGGIK
jgi:hypothetical protein